MDFARVTKWLTGQLPVVSSQLPVARSSGQH
jgi:hypothetical protein